MTIDAAVPARAGVGFKLEHFDAIAADWAAACGSVGWFEVHAENYMGAGGPPLRRLEALRERFPISVHGVGLSIGAEQGLDPTHLERLAGVVARFRPGLVSEHLAWSTHDGVYLNDLLPPRYDAATAARVAEHIGRVQDRLGRRILLENPSSYLLDPGATLSEIELLERVVERSGCGLLLDVNNVHISAVNRGFDAVAYLDAFPLAHVGEIHLAGHAPDADEGGAALLIDTHDRPVADPVWALYAHVIGRIGPRPTLIEWDDDLPDWPTLVAEAARAEATMRAAETETAATKTSGGRVAA